MWRTILLYPFSLIYGIIVWLRNRLYDSGFIGSAEFDLPVISIGNLQAGGTGKTPMADYLARLLKPHLKVAILSRGYRRKTSGFILANNTHTAADIGDEPWMLQRKHPDIQVAVGESREVAIPLMVSARPDIQLILLDDAYQHRSVQPSLSILLTTYEKPFWKDNLLPAGNLREPVSEKKRADIIIVTKCPATLQLQEEKELLHKIAPLPEQKMFFSSLVYGDPYTMHGGEMQALKKTDTVLLFAGIAYPEPMISYVQDNVEQVFWLPYEDHHTFNGEDLRHIAAEFRKMPGNSKRVLTTEKDAARLLSLQAELLQAQLPVEVLPSNMVMTGSNAGEFDDLILRYLQFYWS
jgi:tetraacyldisaccharide 4'-kinase